MSATAPIGIEPLCGACHLHHGGDCTDEHRAWFRAGAPTSWAEAATTKRAVIEAAIAVVEDCGNGLDLIDKDEPLRKLRAALKGETE